MDSKIIHSSITRDISLLEMGIINEDVNILTNNGLNALILTLFGSIETNSSYIDKLLSYNIDVNHVFNDNINALMIACYKGNIDAVIKLIDVCNIESVDRLGRNALVYNFIDLPFLFDSKFIKDLDLNISVKNYFKNISNTEYDILTNFNNRFEIVKLFIKKDINLDIIIPRIVISGNFYNNMTLLDIYLRNLYDFNISFIHLLLDNHVSFNHYFTEVDSYTESNKNYKDKVKYLKKIL